MSTKRSHGPGVPAQKTPRSAATSRVGRLTATKKKDRSTNLCAFTFADGRQCRTPRCSGHLYLCYFHAQKEAESLASQQVGQDISRFLPVKLLTACDLGAAMSRLFCAVAQGHVKPKVASTLAYLAQTMLQSIPIAQHEYIESFNTNTWRNAVRVSFRFDDPPNTPAPQSEIPTLSGPSSKPPASPASSPSPACHPACPDPVGERSEGSHLTPASRSAQPAPSPHTPLPPTTTAFAQQVLAGRNSSRSELPILSGSDTPTLPEPGRENGSSDSSCSSTSSSASPSSASSSLDSAPARTSSTQPAPSSPTPPPAPDNSQPAPAPPAQQPAETPANCRSSLACPPWRATSSQPSACATRLRRPRQLGRLNPPQTPPQILSPLALARMTE